MLPREIKHFRRWNTQGINQKRNGVLRGNSEHRISFVAAYIVMKRQLAFATFVEITGIDPPSIEYRSSELTVLIWNAPDHCLIGDLLASTLNFVRDD